MKRRIANLLMPWVARNAMVWLSTHAMQAKLLAEVKSLCAALERIAEEESDIDGAREIARGALSRRVASDEGPA